MALTRGTCYDPSFCPTSYNSIEKLSQRQFLGWVSKHSQSQTLFNFYLGIKNTRKFPYLFQITYKLCKLLYIAENVSLPIPFFISQPIIANGLLLLYENVKNIYKLGQSCTSLGERKIKFANYTLKLREIEAV